MKGPVHRTLPIPQVDPPADFRADPEPGRESSTLPPLPPKIMARKFTMRTPVYERHQDTRGIDEGMHVLGAHAPTPMVQLPVRSSLAQDVLAFRVQISHYISRVKPFGMAPGYPTAKVWTLLNTAPRNMGRKSVPTISKANRGPMQPRVSSPGFMLPPKRFPKALNIEPNDYEPPTY